MGSIVIPPSLDNVYEACFVFILAFSVKNKFESAMPCAPKGTRTPRQGQAMQNYGFAGGFSDRATPVPIPNTAVKPVCAHGTAGATLWESRSSPALYFSAPRFTPKRGARCYWTPCRRLSRGRAQSGFAAAAKILKPRSSTSPVLLLSTTTATCASRKNPAKLRQPPVCPLCQ